MTRARRGGFFPPDDEDPSEERPRRPPFEPTAGLGTHHRFQPRGSFAPLEGAAPEPSAWARHRGKLTLVAAAVAMAIVAWALPADVLRTAYWGEGYVRWRNPRWKAQQQAKKLHYPLVVYRTDPRHSDNDAFRRRILAVPKVQDLATYLVWYHEEEQGPDAEPAPPEVSIVAVGESVDEVLLEPTPISDLTPDSFYEAMREAREAVDDGGGATGAAPGFW